MKNFLSLSLLFSFIAVAQTIPPLTVTINDSSKTEGYYYFVPFTISLPADYAPTQMILDRYGRIVYYRFFGEGGPLGASTDFKIQPNGKMSYHVGNKFYIMDSTFTIIDSVSAANGYTMDPHELRILPNGNFLFLAVKDTTMNLVQYKWFGTGHNEPGLPNATVKTAVIQELDPQKNLVFEWVSTYPNRFSFGDVDSVWLNLKNNVDWTHSNALDIDSDGNILLSTRHFNEITKINRTTGQIMWRFGGKKNQFVFSNDTIGFTGQHFIRRIPNGNVTLFDNGKFTDPPVARALEYKLDEVNKIAELKWEYIHDSNVSSTAMGSVQRLANGNTLINYGFIPQTHPSVALVDSMKNLIFDIKLPAAYASYRIYNYKTLPFSLPRPEIKCLTLNGQNYLTTDSGYTSYKWSTGATTQTIPITSTGTYNVFVPFGGGYISSAYYVVNDMNNPCQLSAVDDEEYTPSGHQLYQNYPNPFNPSTTISYQLESASKVSLKIFDILGNEIISLDEVEKLSGEHKISIDGRDLASGVYFYTLRAISTKDGSGFSQTKKMVVLK